MSTDNTPTNQSRTLSISSTSSFVLVSDNDNETVSEVDRTGRCTTTLEDQKYRPTNYNNSNEKKEEERGDGAEIEEWEEDENGEEEDEEEDDDEEEDEEEEEEGDCSDESDASEEFGEEYDYCKASYEDSEDDLLSMDGSEDITLDPPISTHVPRISPRKLGKNEAPIAHPFPYIMPPKIVHSIFSYLTHNTLHTLLTVNKAWFQYVADHLYRDPFGTIDRARGRIDKVQLRPNKERLLVRLLLRSIHCPSEPGEVVILNGEALDDENNFCKVMDNHGVEIRTTTNYIRFLEVFEWAPWKRYLDFWTESSPTVQVANFSSIAPKGDLAPTFFRFSYHTIIDWFSENKNARAVVLHPEMDFTPQMAQLLPRWTTLYFDQKFPPSYFSDAVSDATEEFGQVSTVRSPNYYATSNSYGLLEALLDHEAGDESKTVDGKRKSAIEELQLPPDFYYELDQYSEAVASLLLVTRPLSLDASACRNWKAICMEIPDENIQGLTRFVCVGEQTDDLPMHLFLSRCPNLKEIEMTVTDEDDLSVGIGALEVARLYSRSCQFICSILKTITSNFSHSLRVLRLDLAQSALPSIGQKVFTINGKTFCMPHLEELYLHLARDINLETAEPFNGCPSLQRLMLVTKDYLFVERKFNVPRTLREFMLHGYWIQSMFREKCIDELLYLESLELLDDGYTCKNPKYWYSTTYKTWKPRNVLCSLKSLTLSGVTAKSFQFEWMLLLPALEVLEVRGLDYTHVLKIDTSSADSSEIQYDYPELPPSSLVGSSVLKTCKLTIVNAECLRNSAEDTIKYLLKLGENLPIMKGGPLDFILPLETLFKMLSMSDMKIDPPVNQAFLQALSQYCPAIQQLTIDFENESDSPTDTDSSSITHPIELQMDTAARLKRFFPKLTEFKTDSIMLNRQKLSMLRVFGFFPRAHSDFESLQFEDCIFRFGEADYLKVISN
ncbi:hypothetical protein BGZ49_001497 [Haplosporangium sp. Z 27]|nr:hypothetical protein BGZ49_001497 [Haplosporangium sp. Z 27]